MSMVSLYHCPFDATIGCHLSLIMRLAKCRNIVVSHDARAQLARLSMVLYGVVGGPHVMCWTSSSHRGCLLLHGAPVTNMVNYRPSTKVALNTISSLIRLSLACYGRSTIPLARSSGCSPHQRNGTKSRALQPVA